MTMLGEVVWDEDGSLTFLITILGLWFSSLAAIYGVVLAYSFLSCCLDRGSFLVCIIAETLGLGSIWDGKPAFKKKMEGCV